MKLKKIGVLYCCWLASYWVSIAACASEWQMINDLSFSARAAHDYANAQQQVQTPTTVWPRPMQVDQPVVRPAAELWLDARSGRAFFTGFQPRATEGVGFRVQHQGKSQDYRVQLQVGYDTDEAFVPADNVPADNVNGDDAETQWIADGSFVDIGLYHWRVGGGAVSRWWGPGWDSSLILSNNARPAPGLYVERGVFTPFESAWLSWLGPWHFTTFMSQLESDRDFAHTLLWGARFTFKPIAALEIGLNRTALWGGEGRPQSLSVFKDLLLGDDNFSENQVGKSTEPGDQLGGIDFKYTYIQNQHVYACYTQFIGEDEAGGLPTGFLGLAGCSWQTPGQTFAPAFLQTMQLSTIFVEFSNTAMGGWTGDETFGVAYEHSIYRDGYRYHDRPVGSQYDNDSKSAVIGWLLQQSARRSYRVMVRNLELNEGDLNAVLPSGNRIAHSSLTTQQLDLSVSQTWQHYRADLGYLYNTDIAPDALLNARATWLAKLTWLLN